MGKKLNASLSKIKELTKKENKETAKMLAYLEKEMKENALSGKTVDALTFFDTIENELEGMELSVKSQNKVRKYLDKTLKEIVGNDTYTNKTQKKQRSLNSEKNYQDSDFVEPISSKRINTKKKKRKGFFRSMRSGLKRTGSALWAIPKTIFSLPKRAIDATGGVINLASKMKTSLRVGGGIAAAMGYTKLAHDLKEFSTGVFDKIGLYAYKIKRAVGMTLQGKLDTQLLGNGEYPAFSSGMPLDAQTAHELLSPRYTLSSRLKGSSEDGRSNALGRTGLEGLHSDAVVGALRLADYIHINLGVTEKPVITGGMEEGHKTHKGQELDIRSTDAAGRRLIAGLKLQLNRSYTTVIKGQKMTFLYHGDNDGKHKHIHVKFHKMPQEETFA